MHGGVSLENRSIIGVGGDGVPRGELVGVPDHAEEGVGFCSAVDSPRGVELLVAAVLGVDLREHEEFDIIRVTGAGPSGGEGVKEVGDLGGVEGEAEGLVGGLKGLEWGGDRRMEVYAANGKW